MEYLGSGVIAIVDLKNSNVEMEEVPEEQLSTRIGGVGITTRLFKKYEAEDPIILGTGLLTGTLVPGASLGVITARSPRNGRISHAPFCLYAGMELKYAGFDYVVIKGRSESPSYLWLHDGVADIHDGSSYWGMSPWEISDSKIGLRNLLGDDLIQLLTIGNAGEKGSDLAQVFINCWSSGDRWGFGKLFGEKKLKAVAMRGMSLFEIANPNLFLGRCAELLHVIKKGDALGHKGCFEFPKALGEEDISDWISPLVHRHSSCFNCPYPTNTFVKYKEDPKTLQETEIEEPGILITDVFGLTGFKRLGLSAEDSCRMLESCSRYGIDPVAASALLMTTGKRDTESLTRELSALTSTNAVEEISTFSPWCPTKPLFSDFGLTEGSPQVTSWWKRRQCIAYLFGIHPILAVMCPEISEERLIDLVKLGTELEINPKILNHLIEELTS